MPGSEHRPHVDRDADAVAGMGVGAHMADATVVIVGHVVARHVFLGAVLGTRFAALLVAALDRAARIDIAATTARVVRGDRAADHGARNRRGLAAVTLAHLVAESATDQRAEDGGPGRVAAIA